MSEAEGSERLETRDLRANDAALVALAGHLESAGAAIFDAWRAAVVVDHQLDAYRDLGYEFSLEIPTVLAAVASALRGAGEHPALPHEPDRFRQGHGFHQSIRELTLLRRVLFEEIARFRRSSTALDDEAADRAYGVVIGVIDELTSETARAFGQARAELEGELKRSNRRLREQDETKQRFVSTVAHELRSPLNVIAGVAQILARSRESLGDLARLADMLERNVDGLIRLINDLLDYSRLTAAREEVQLERFDPAAAITPIVDGFRVQIAGGPVSLELELDGPPPEVLSDRVKVVQIVTNLVANAVKFTETGSIVVCLRTVPGRCWQVEVRDTGVGIAQADLARVFDEFVRLDRQAAGTGLGLSIARRAAEAMGGALDASSVRGQGSTFRLTLPLESHLEAAGE
jgi:signal transduction histidine kinase